MALHAGDRIGPYEIVAPIGRGGMGEVWRARDGKLQRDVAIKALPEELRTDSERLSRFEREARLLAALNHPGIASIFGLEKQDGTTYIVMELVEGTTLAERLAAGALPMEEALEVALGIAAGLEAAHGAGIIHRDLKPANVKVRPDGSVKLLDLGLARTIETSGAVDSSLSPTITTPATHAGVILGTAAYMSPEQARGRPVDKRTDIFSFGCVLYECLTGKQTFRGETVSDTLASILKSDPDWSLLPDALPGGARDVLKRCLQKDAKRRLHDIADARIEIEEAISGGSEPLPAAPVARPRRFGTLAAGIAGAIVGAALVALAWRASRSAPQPSAPSVRAVLGLASGDTIWTGRPLLAISPDGRTVVFAAVRAGVPSLFRRRLASATAEPIQGTEQGSRPFFSPDGEWIGFIVRNELRKVPLSGGTGVLLANVPPITAPGTWGSDGRIVFTLGANSALYEITATGGAARQLTKLDSSRGEHAHLYPQILPGGRAILFTLRLGRDFTDVDASNIDVLETATGRRRTVLEGATFARYGGGRIVFVRGASLFSAPFDLSSLSVTGPPVVLGEEVAREPLEGIAHFAISADGTLAFVDGPAVTAPTTQVLKLDRGGRETAVRLPAGNYFFPRLSPDGRRLALVRFAGIRSAIVVYDRDREILSTLTPEPGRFVCPVWSPDGRTLAFGRMTVMRPVLSVKNADGSGEIRPLTAGSPNAELPSSWSPDGNAIACTVNYTADQSATRRMLTSDIWLGSPHEKRLFAPWFETPFREGSPAFSPDGRWVAYVSDESGGRDIYVRPYPGPGAPVKVSTESGTEPAWSRGGRELLYRAEEGEKFLAVEIRTSPELQISPPRVLFSSQLNRGGQWFGTVMRDAAFREYDVSPDGNEIFSTRMVRVEEPARRLQIVTNWAGEPNR